MTRIQRLASLSVVLLGLAATGCGQDNGERCERGSDCSSGYCDGEPGTVGMTSAKGSFCTPSSNPTGAVTPPTDASAPDGSATSDAADAGAEVGDAAQDRNDASNDASNDGGVDGGIDSGSDAGTDASDGGAVEHAEAGSADAVDGSGTEAGGDASGSDAASDGG